MHHRRLVRRRLAALPLTLALIAALPAAADASTLTLSYEASGHLLYVDGGGNGWIDLNGARDPEAQRRGDLHHPHAQALDAGSRGARRARPR